MKHPVIARRRDVVDGPYRGQVGDAHRQLRRSQALVQQPRAGIPNIVEAAIQTAYGFGLETQQELVHGPHDVGVCIERAPGKADIGRPILAKAAHELGEAAQHSDGKPSGHGLAIGHHVRAHAEVFLRSARRKPEPDEDLVENQYDAPRAADFAQPAQPRGIGLAVEVRLAAAVDEGGVARRADIGVQGLQGVDQHAGDIAPVAQHPQARLVHVLQGIRFAGRQRIAHAGLHVSPPAMIGAAESHQMRAPGVVARQPYRLHDGFGARHVKGHFFQTGNLQQAPHVVGGHRVIGAQHRPQPANALAAPLDALLVEVVAEYIDPVRARQIVEPVAVEIGDGDAGRGLYERACLEVPPHESAELERHAIAGSELQVGDPVGDFAGELGRLLEPFGKHRGQSHEARVPGCGNLLRGAVGAEEMRFVVFVERHQRRETARHSRMPRQRAMLGERQLQANLQFAQQDGERHAAQHVKNCGCNSRVPQLPGVGLPGVGALYCRRMTLR